MIFQLPDLPYDMNALEPHISSRTLDFHHGKHHATYVKNLNNLVKDSKFLDMQLTDIIKETFDKADNVAIFNNAAQAWNHDFYWKSIKREGGGMPTGELARRIKDDFGDFDEFIQQLKHAGKTQFGSGWVWLVLNKLDNKLKVSKTSNADNPMVRNQIPLITIDVWEHAYYLDYQNKRPDYIEVFMQHLINWDFAGHNLDNNI